MNDRLTVTAAVATVLASVALYSLISRSGWFWGRTTATEEDFESPLTSVSTSTIPD